MIWLTLLFILHVDFCNAQEIDDSCNDSANETECCTNDTKCIGQYIDLEMYILNNKTLLDKLTETFYTAEGVVSDFVKITYNFQTNNGRKSEKDSTTNCSIQQITYIWSENDLYLLGPEVVFWLTIFAVNIHEADVTVDLPCLYSDVYHSLLDRLTSLVCIINYIVSYIYVHVFACSSIKPCTYIYNQ